MSQSEDQGPAELIIQLSPYTSTTQVFNQHARAKKSHTAVLSKRKNIHLLSVPAGEDVGALIDELSTRPDVLYVRRNRRMQKRGGFATPNDPFFSSQWNLARIGLPELWDRTMGGITPCGDTIVIAVNDFGFDLEHEDMQNLIWKNRQEIPNNGFDDDGNGYKDDFLGLNVDTDDDKHIVDEEDYHGTAVASVIASNTNNGLGMAGINWHVKLLIISSQESDEAGAIKAFEYVRALRKKYNDTNGAEGAYIVALNNSWGYEGGFEEDFQVLCDMFNDLGEVGILTVGSTENDQVNTDVFGDFPSDCSSDYLIVVTNSDEQDELSVAGFGEENVDLSAPGEGIYVADKSNGYQTTGGTSFATPHVSGAIGLIYSLDKATFCDDARLSPTEAIRQLKRYILEGTTPLPTLQGKTVSGGRLNLMNTADMVTGTKDLMEQSFIVYPNPLEAQLHIDARYFGNNLRLAVYDVVGKIIYQESPPPGRSRILQIETANWPSGTYLVQLKDSQHHGLQKVVKISK
ncbi:MAG: S8 family serine peptidase [Saprospiraceae bacterium]|nr:S8 family serine peptidase [Saprospiraceae bacterium]